ncbi:MAG TPA: response regulator [Candidatus Brocadiia bacterium]|nr:response regulator [Candidatus Brocadiia bacterium]
MIKGIILLVDDDEILLRLLSRSFENSGFRAVLARNGRDALQKLKIVKPDLIISDVNMPEMDGFQLFGELQLDDETAGIPFLFLTERSALQDRLKGLEMGCTDYLPKPVDPRELVVRAKMTIDRSMAQAGRSEAFRGRLEDLPTTSLVKVICRSGQSCAICLRREDRSGRLYLRDSEIIDAELDGMLPLDAAVELLDWNSGDFEVEFKDFSNPAKINLSVDVPEESQSEIGIEETTADSRLPELSEPTTQLDTAAPPGGIPELEQYLNPPVPPGESQDREAADAATSAASVDELLKSAAELVMERRYCAAMEALESALACEPGNPKALSALKELSRRIEGFKSSASRIAAVTS